MAYRCDLLSIFGIFDITNSNCERNTLINVVVICFQFLVSLTSLTANINISGDL
ncbi:MAG: hypothetical protein H6Q20_1957 [Bacteroidetes bacterium]|nr:hypothetical protein [Bacteroidota bacterium]